MDKCAEAEKDWLEIQDEASLNFVILKHKYLLVQNEYKYKYQTLSFSFLLLSLFPQTFFYSLPSTFFLCLSPIFLSLGFFNSLRFYFFPSLVFLFFHLFHFLTTPCIFKKSKLFQLSSVETRLATAKSQEEAEEVKRRRYETKLQSLKLEPLVFLIVTRCGMVTTYAGSGNYLCTTGLKFDSHPR